MIGLQRCSLGDWLLLAGFLLLCSMVSGVAMTIVRREQQLKKVVGYGMVPSDVILTSSTMIKLVIFAVLSLNGI